MPVEIKELVIRAVAQSSDYSRAHARDEDSHSSEKRSLVEACVREVLRILNRSEER